MPAAESFFVRQKNNMMDDGRIATTFLDRFFMLLDIINNNPVWYRDEPIEISQKNQFYMNLFVCACLLYIYNMRTKN
jgi:hypothetical protein